MLKSIMTTLRWSFSIGNKFFKVIPRVTISIVLATLVSQFSILLAFLLPLKVIMLLGSAGVPQYFPPFLTNVDQNLLVVSLSLSAVVFYFIYFLAEKAIAHEADKGAALLLEKSQKMTLFENQEEIASRGYQRYSSSLASSIFISFVAVGLSWLYPELLLTLFLYIVVAFLILSLLYSSNREVKAALDKSPNKIINTTTSLGFLLAFGFMVAHFLLGNPPALLVAVISLILMRQVFSRITGLVNDLKGLYDQRFKLNALFFHGHVLMIETMNHEASFWGLLQSPQREQWILDAIENVTSLPVETVKVQWWQLNVQDVASLRVSSFDQDGKKNAELLVKLFNANRSSLAKHEASLLSENYSLPALKLLGVTKSQEFHCHVFEWTPAKKPTQQQLKHVREEVNKSLIAIEPSMTLVSRFSRSRPLIWQRFDNRMLERLHTVAEMLGGEYVSNAAQLSSQQHLIRSRLRNVPLAITNVEFGADAFLETTKGKFLVVQWGRWKLEPVGTNWPIQPNDLERLSVALKEAKNLRHALRDIDERDVYLAALMSSLENLYVRQDFLAALKLIPRILQYLETITENSIEYTGTRGN